MVKLSMCPRRLIVCTMLPCLLSESELVPLKRKLSYKGYYLYDYVCPERLNNALKWLKVNNPLYADIEIDGNWVASAIPDDKDLVMSMLKQPECMSEGSNDPEPMDTSTSSVCNPEPTNASSNTPSDPVSHYADVLESFARDHGLRVHNVPRDGNCLFTSVAYQLQSVGNDVNESSLRQMVVDYLSGHGDVYSLFLPQSVASDDGYNAENEPVDEKDAYIESITDPEVQQELHWQKYLR